VNPAEALDVPFVDLGPASSAVRERVLARLAETLDSGDFVNGAAVTEFELRFASRCSHRG
jgi:dTDP-4-amino-4,6-dideoxygalactose transaminase